MPRLRRTILAVARTGHRKEWPVRRWVTWSLRSSRFWNTKMIETLSASSSTREVLWEDPVVLPEENVADNDGELFELQCMSSISLDGMIGKHSLTQFICRLYFTLFNIPSHKVYKIGGFPWIGRRKLWYRYHRLKSLLLSFCCCFWTSKSQSSLYSSSV
jgi:hypothetical protein